LPISDWRLPIGDWAIEKSVEGSNSSVNPKIARNQQRFELGINTTPVSNYNRQSAIANLKSAIANRKFKIRNRKSP